MTLVHRVFKEVRISYAEVYADNLICFGGKTEAKLCYTEVTELSPHLKEVLLMHT